MADSLLSSGMTEGWTSSFLRLEIILHNLISVWHYIVLSESMSDIQVEMITR